MSINPNYEYFVIQLQVKCILYYIFVLGRNTCCRRRLGYTAPRRIRTAAIESTVQRCTASFSYWLSWAFASSANSLHQSCSAYSGQSSACSSVFSSPTRQRDRGEASLWPVALDKLIIPEQFTVNSLEPLIPKWLYKMVASMQAAIFNCQCDQMQNCEGGCETRYGEE